MALGTIVSGVKGSVTWPKAGDGFGFTTTAVDAHVIRWSMTVTREEHDTTTFNVTDNYRTFVGGMASFTGRMEGYLASGESLDFIDLQNEDQAAVATCVLTAFTGRTYTFAGLITGADVGVDKGGTATFSLTFRGSGPFTSIA